MKKHLLLFVFAFVAIALQAQERANSYSLMYLEREGYYHHVMNLIQQHDGDFVTSTIVFEDLGNHESIRLGNMFYKISPTTFTITDSLFVADPTQDFFLLTRDPRGEGNIRVKFEYREDCDSTFMRICHFPDNDLHANPEEDMMVPICKGFVYPYDGLVDCMGDLIISYAKVNGTALDVYTTRVDPNGILKHHALVFESLMENMSTLRVLKESPLQYYRWNLVGASPVNDIGVYEIDSLFHTNHIVLNSILRQEPLYPNSNVCENEYLEVNYDSEVIPVGGDDILVAAQYCKDTTAHLMTAEHGVAVAKYNLRTMQLKGYVVFNDYLGSDNRSQCLGLKMMKDGTVYFMFKEHPYPDESILIVKMDTDLNVDWKRFCKTENLIMDAPMWLPILVLYDDEQGVEKGVAWAGTGRKTGNNHNGIVYFFLDHDCPVNVADESGITVRPYGFYPNPAKDRLCMEFSPDVQPAKVELYDLQGRLVRSQRSAFESINMSQLPAGTYMMRVTMEDGRSYSDKVMKE